MRRCLFWCHHGIDGCRRAGLACPGARIADAAGSGGRRIGGAKCKSSSLPQARARSLR